LNYADVAGVDIVDGEMEVVVFAGGRKILMERLTELLMKRA